MIFQSVRSALDRRMKLRQTLSEMVTVHRIQPKVKTAEGVDELADRTHLTSSLGGSRPRSLSGFQRYRESLPYAHTVQRHVLIADEAVFAMDVSVQLVAFNLLMERRCELYFVTRFSSHHLKMDGKLPLRVWERSSQQLSLIRSSLCCPTRSQRTCTRLSLGCTAGRTRPLLYPGIRRSPAMPRQAARSSIDAHDRSTGVPGTTSS